MLFSFKDFQNKNANGFDLVIGDYDALSDQFRLFDPAKQDWVLETPKESIKQLALQASQIGALPGSDGYLDLDAFAESSSGILGSAIDASKLSPSATVFPSGKGSAVVVTVVCRSDTGLPLA